MCGKGSANHPCFQGNGPHDLSECDTPPTEGLVKGVSVGNTTFFATFKGVQGSATVTVSAATLTSIDVIPASSTLPKGTTQQLIAIGNFSANESEVYSGTPWSPPDAEQCSVVF